MKFIINLIGLTILNTMLRSIGFGFWEMLLFDIIVLGLVTFLTYESKTKENDDEPKL